MELNHMDETKILKEKIKILEEKLAKANESEIYLSVLNDTALSIMNRIDLGHILDIIVIKSCEFAGIQNGFIYLLEPDESNMKLRAGIGLFKKYIDDKCRPDEGLVGKVWASGKPMSIKNYKEWEGKREIFEISHFHSIIGIPIFSANKVSGVFGITYQENEEVSFDRVMELFKGFTQLASIALDNSKLFSYLQDEFSEVIRVESELRESEYRYRTLFEMATHGIFLCDERIITECNEKMLDIFGYKKDDMIGRDISIFSSKNQIDNKPPSLIWDEYISRALSGSVSIFEWDFIKAENKTFHSEIILSRLSLEGNYYILGMVSDITEKKQISEELKRQQILLSDIFLRVQEGIAMLDKDANIIYCNPGFDSIFEDSVENLTARNFYDFLSEEYRSDISNKIISEAPKGVITCEIPINTTKGNIKYVRLSASPYFDKDNIYTGTFISMLDITARKNREEALRLSEDKFSKVFFRSLDLIVIFILDDNSVLDANNLFCEFVGLNREELIGKKVNDLKLKDDNFKNCVFDVLNDPRQIMNLECVCKNSKNEERIFLISADLIEVENKKCLLHISRDITELRLLQEDLQKSKNLESIGILAGGIAHNFNNILTGIMGNISLAKLYSKPGEKIHERLQEAEKNSFKAKDLANQLVTFAKGGKPYKKYSSVINIINRTTQKILSGHDVSFEIITKEDLWNTELDESQIFNALSYIILNAKESMENLDNKSIKILIENCEVKENTSFPSKPGKYLKISIQDFGSGIDKSISSKIFDPFFTTKPGKKGIGLSIAYSIIKRHDGFIDFVSNDNSGTTFRIFLPISRDYSVTVIQNEVKKNVIIRKILLMDDEPEVRDFSSELFKYLEYQYTLTKNGDETIEAFKKAIDDKQPYDIVILDLIIPGGIGGKEVLSKLKEIDPKVKAIVSSGYSHDPIIANYQKHGFVSALVKPYRAEDMANTINKISGS
jgi:PAS domain S-box-containing protein